MGGHVPFAGAFRLPAIGPGWPGRAPGDQGGLLTVSVLPSLASKWLVPRLYDFRARHPGDRCPISATERLEQIGQGDIDVAIRYGRGAWRSRGGTAAGDDLFPICSPKLLTCEKPLKEPGSDIANFTLLSDNDWRPARFDFWHRWIEKAGIVELDLKAGITFNFSNLMIQAAMEGLGIALATPCWRATILKAGGWCGPSISRSSWIPAISWSMPAP